MSLQGPRRGRPARMLAQDHRDLGGSPRWYLSFQRRRQFQHRCCRARLALAAVELPDGTILKTPGNSSERFVRAVS